MSTSTRGAKWLLSLACWQQAVLCVPGVLRGFSCSVARNQPQRTPRTQRRNANVSEQHTITALPTCGFLRPGCIGRCILRTTGCRKGDLFDYAIRQGHSLHLHSCCSNSTNLCATIVRNNDSSRERP